MRVLFHRLAIATMVLTFVLMMLGGYVKAIGAGLSCPDWPTCYGQWNMFDATLYDHRGLTVDGYGMTEVFAEWFHRLVASVVGPMILSVAIMAWRLDPLDKRVRFWASTAMVLLPTQIILGGLTVTQDLQPFIVVSHLGFATLIFGSLVATVVFSAVHPHLAAARGAPSAEQAGEQATDATSEASA